MCITASIVRVAIPVPLYALYDYRAVDTGPRPGMRVLVPFGRRQLVGIVIAAGVTPAVAETQLKHITECLDTSPLLDTDLLALCRWSARYYHIHSVTR